MFKVNNKKTKTRCKICPKLTIKTPGQRHWRRSGVFIVNFEHISHLALGFLLMTLSKLIPAGICFASRTVAVFCLLLSLCFAVFCFFCLVFNLFFVQIYDQLTLISSVLRVYLFYGTEDLQIVRAMSGQDVCLFFGAILILSSTASNHFKFGMRDIQATQKP